MNKLRKQSDSTYPLFFLMVDSTDHVTGKTGLSPTVTISKNGASYASPSGSVTEVGNGVYKIAGNATDSNTLGELWIHATGTAADPSDCAYTIVPFDPFDSVRLGLTALPNAAAEAAGGLYTRGSGAGQINQPTNGRIDANAVSVSGTTLTARDIGASVLLSSGTGTGQVSITSGVVSSNMTQIDGLATNGNNATLKLKSLDLRSNDVAVSALEIRGANGGAGENGGKALNLVGGNGGSGSTMGSHGITSVGGSGSTSNGYGVLLDAPFANQSGLYIRGNTAGAAIISGYNGFDIVGNLYGNVNYFLALGSQAKADINAEVKDVLENDTQPEPTGPPSSTSSLRDKIGWLFTMWRNKRTQSSTQEKVYADNGTTVIGTSSKSDSGTTFTRGKYQ
jgi:hypothetical protein